MDTEHFQTLLHAKQRELKTGIARLEHDARHAPTAEVQDPIDQVTADEGKAAALEASSIEYAMLREVQDALKRIDEKTYGICIDCGKRIADARLEAVPWTPWCRDDQEKHDQQVRSGEPGEAAL